MCGIAGMVGPGTDENIVRSAIAAQLHRGPDGEGVWSGPVVVLGHRRLKIIDLTDAGRQPMSTPDGRYTITYNGEVYNYRELRTQLPNSVFRSQTDTEVVLHAYANWGPACLERFVGMFSFAIWDSVERQLFCCRDRLGIKPFYYAQLDGNFLFASELRALLAAGVARAVNHSVLYDFLAYDFYEHRDETFFAQISKLPAGSWMIVNGDGTMKVPRRYWDLASEAARVEVSPNAEQREETLLKFCFDAVDLHLRSDVPVGVELSGGLDSATLLSILDRVHPDPTRVESFTWTFAEEAYSEEPFARAMAEHTGRRAHFVQVSPKDFIDTAERFCVAQEEPFAGLPISAHALCAEAARRHGFIVIMEGSGLDEILAGYDRFRPALWADLFSAAQWQVLEQELAAAGVTSAGQRRQALFQMQAAAQPQSDVGKGQDLTSSVRPECLNPDFVRTAGEPSTGFERPFHNNLRDLMYRELRFTKLPRALRFRDRLSMAVSTEMRPPFLDHRLVAYAFALPAEDLICRGRSKAILRRAATRVLPDAIRMASKRSVQTPQREWFRNELKEWVRDHIDTPSFWQRGWVNPVPGRKAMEAFFRGEGDNSFFLWQWINLELWAQQFLDGQVEAETIGLRASL